MKNGPFEVAPGREHYGLEAKSIIYDGGPLRFKGERWDDLVVRELVQAGALFVCACP
jgi:hypothetical protein